MRILASAGQEADVLIKYGILEQPACEGEHLGRFSCGFDTYAGNGDLHVRVIVEVPAKLNGKQKRILAQFGEETSESNYPLRKRHKKMAEELYERREKMKKKKKG